MVYAHPLTSIFSFLLGNGGPGKCACFYLDVPPYAPGIAHCEECAPAQQGLNALMNGDPDAAVEIFHEIEMRDPQSPLGCLLQADATWGKISLTTANLIDPDVFDVVDSKTFPYDAHFQELINSAIQKAEAGIHAHEGVPRR